MSVNETSDERTSAENPVDEKIVTASTEPSFESLGLSEKMCGLLTELGYETPTPIQMQAIPVLLEGRDLIGQAQTGTGKTAAFALPIVAKIDFDLQAPQVLVLTPTRELAIQVAEAFQTYARGQKNFHVLPIYGGQSIGQQLRQLERRPQVIVGTPGRVMDHLNRKSLSLASIRTVVMDEADEMLSMGFQEDIESIISHTPEEKQMALFSATMPKAVRHVAQSYLRNPKEVVISRTAAKDSLIDQSYWFVNGLHKLDALTRILDATEFDGVLVFVRTRTAALELAEKLEARGYSAGPLNGDMSQEARERTVERLKQGQLDILVATDVAARGLDVERISHVINFDIPFDAETYTHRIGRTGRAGRTGTAIMFVSSREMGLLRSIERDTRARMNQFTMPTREDISQLRIERFKAKVGAALQAEQLEEHTKIVQDLSEEYHASDRTIAAALCALLQEESAPQHEEMPVVPDRRNGGNGQGRHGGGNGGGQRDGGRDGHGYFGGGRFNDRPQREGGFRRRDDQQSGWQPRGDAGPRRGDNFQPRADNGPQRERRTDSWTPRPERSERPFEPGRDDASGPRRERSWTPVPAGDGRERSDREQPRAAAPQSEARPAWKKPGDKPAGEKRFGDKPVGDKKFGDKKFADKKPGEKKSFKGKPNGPSTGERRFVKTDERPAGPAAWKSKAPASSTKKERRP